MKSLRNFVVIGAGNGGKAMAAHLALIGKSVVLYNRNPDHISEIKARMGIDLESIERQPHGFAKLALVTSDISEALKDSEMIMVVVPSTAHADIAKRVAPHLRDGQIIVLHPGRTFGALEFVKVLRDNACEADVTVAEAETLIFIARSDGPAQVRIFGIKEAVPIAALPAVRTNLVLRAIHQVFPQFINGVNVLHTGLNNMGAIFHPTVTLLNAGRIESTKEDFKFYIEGLTPSVAKVLEILDVERVNVALSLGIRAQTALEWVKMAYNTTGVDLWEAIHKQTGYYEVNAPRSLQHRYLFEEVPMGLVPIASLGRNNGVSVSGISSMVQLACMIDRTDYWSCGRTLEKLGLTKFSVTELTRYVNEGELGRL